MIGLDSRLGFAVVYLVGGEQSIGAKIVLGWDAIVDYFTTAEYIKRGEWVKRNFERARMYKDRADMDKGCETSARPRPPNQAVSTPRLRGRVGGEACILYHCHGRSTLHHFPGTGWHTSR